MASISNHFIPLYLSCDNSRKKLLLFLNASEETQEAPVIFMYTAAYCRHMHCEATSLHSSESFIKRHCLMNDSLAVA